MSPLPQPNYDRTVTQPLSRESTPLPTPVRVTIAMPVYNGENFMEAAIDSILAQSFTEFELLISDNGSTDRTQEVCRRYAAHDARVRYVRSDVNRGAGWNYENARSLARGTDYFKWAAHDDIIAPTFLERCVAALDADPGAVLAFSGVAAIDAEGTVLRLKRRQVEALRPRPSERFRGIICTDADPEAVFGLMRVAALSHTRGQGDYVASDRVLLAELALQGTFHEVPEVLLFNRDHPTRSVRITGGDFRQLTSWFAPDKPEQFMPNWRLWREYAHARAARADLIRGTHSLHAAPPCVPAGPRHEADRRHSLFRATAVPTVAPAVRAECGLARAGTDGARDRRLRSGRHRALHGRARQRSPRLRHPGRDRGATRPPARSTPHLAHPLG